MSRDDIKRIKDLLDDCFWSGDDDKLEFLENNGYLDRRPYTAYIYYDNYGNYIGNSNDDTFGDIADDILEYADYDEIKQQLINDDVMDEIIDEEEEDYEQ